MLSSVSVPLSTKLLARLLLLLLLVIVHWANHANAISQHPLLLVVLYDGFRWDYLDKFATPNFRELLNDGVRATHVHTVFPTVTMTNHYTILTGWYPENHGIVANNFYDPDYGPFHMANPAHQEDPRWFDTGPEPIWVTNQLENPDRYSGSMLWPTSLSRVKGVGVTYKVGPPLFDESIKNKTRIDDLIQWFLDKDKPINLGLLYFEEPDLVGHHHGPDSKEMENTVIGLDQVTGYLIGQLRSHDLLDKMNIILTADHGLAGIFNNQFIDLSEFVSDADYEDYALGPLGLLTPNPGRERTVYEELQRAEKKYPQMQVHLRNDSLLKGLHYSHSDRICPIIITVDEGWVIGNARTKYGHRSSGEHGYLPSVVNMNPFFVAHGPAFKKDYVTDSVNNIDFYELMCHLLKLSPGPNSGSLHNIKHILASDSRNTVAVSISHPNDTIQEDYTIHAKDTEQTNHSDYTVLTYLLVAALCASISGVFMIGACRQQRIRKRVVSLENVTLFQMERNHEHKVPLLEEESEDL